MMKISFSYIILYLPPPFLLLIFSYILKSFVGI